MPRRRRRAGGLPRADAVGLLDRGHPAAGHPARRGRGGRRRHRRRVRRPAAGAGGRRAAALPAPHLQHRGRHPPRRGARRGAQVVPAHLSRVLRAPSDGARRRRARHHPDRRGARSPFGPDLLFAATDLPGFVLHVEICEDMFVPIPPSAEAALAGATVLANLSGSPITIGRADDRTLLARSASLALPGRLRVCRCGGGRIDHRPGVGRPDDDLGERRPARRIRAIPQGRAAQRRRRRHSSCFAPNGCGWAPSTTTGATTGIRRTRSGASSSPFDPPAGDIGLRREIERFPFVPADPQRLQQDCYEAYSIQVAGLEQRLRALNFPKVVIGVSGGLDSTHALIVAARAMDREGRPRSDILAFTLPGFATGEHTKRNAVELCRALGVTFAEIDITETAKLMLKEMDHPFSRGEKVYDVTFENVQAGPAHRLPVPAGQPARRHRAGHRRSVRARARLVDLRCRRPDVALQRQRRRARKP